MLDASKSYSGFAVTDIEKAKQFYGGALGLEVADLDAGALGTAPSFGSGIARS